MLFFMHDHEVLTGYDYTTTFRAEAPSLGIAKMCAPERRRHTCHRLHAPHVIVFTVFVTVTAR